MDKFSRKAKFEQIKYDMDAVKFHSDKYLAGSVYPLAKQCFQLVQYLKNRNSYEIFQDQQKGEHKYVEPIKL